MQKRLLPLNILLFCLLIALAARITADIITYRMGKFVPAAGRKQNTPPAAPVINEELASFAPILEKGVFGKATQGQLTPIVPNTSQKQAAPAVTQAEILLLGTVQGSFRESFALVQKKGSSEERVFRLGDSVFNAGTLVTVRKEWIEIQNGAQRTKVYTPLATPATTTPPSAPAGNLSPGGMAAQVGSGSYVIDQRALNASLDNIGQAMTDARLLPSIKDGKVEGFRASEVKPQGIFGTIGIKNGDILLRINEFAIDSPEKAIQSFATLKGQSRIKLDLIRDGQPTSFNYDIR